MQEEALHEKYEERIADYVIFLQAVRGLLGLSPVEALK